MKGAQLLRRNLPQDTYRASRDGGPLATRDESRQHLQDTILEAVTLELPGGLAYDVNSLAIDEIREGNACAGLRVRTQANLAGARLRVQLDIAFGDAVVPPPTDIPFRTLLGQPTPTLKGYAIETAVAEKLQAITSVGLITSRLKDYFDLWLIAQQVAVDPKKLEEAIHATFDRRQTEVDPEPPGLTPAYARNATWNRQRSGLLRTNNSQLLLSKRPAGLFSPPSAQLSSVPLGGTSSTSDPPPEPTATLARINRHRAPLKCEPDVPRSGRR